MLTGCIDTIINEHTEDFYGTLGGIDWISLPLIKPYAAVLVDPEIESHSWIINFKDSTMSHNTYGVRKLCIKDSIIYILSGIVDGTGDSIAIKTTMHPTGWYILDTKKKTEKAFSDKTVLEEYIVEHNYSNPEWQDIDSLHDYFASHREEKLPWAPNN